MFVISALVMLAAIAALGFTVFKSLTWGEDKWGDRSITGFRPTVPALMLLVVLLLGTLLNAVGEIPAGKVGVVTQFGAVTGKILQPGVYAVTPFVQGVVVLDTQIHAAVSKASAASRDMQDVATQITLNYRLNPAGAASLWQEIGSDYVDRIIAPSVQEAVKASTAGFDAEELITKRPVVRDMIEDMLRERLVRHHIELDQLSITDFQFSPAFAQAIEMKQVATQNAIKAENEVREARAKADAQIAEARGKAESIRIQAEAVRTQGGREYVQLQWIDAWKTTGGKVPTWITGDAGRVFVTAPER